MAEGQLVLGNIEELMGGLADMEVDNGWLPVIGTSKGVVVVETGDGES